MGAVIADSAENDKAPPPQPSPETPATAAPAYAVEQDPAPQAPAEGQAATAEDVAPEAEGAQGAAAVDAAAPPPAPPLDAAAPLPGDAAPGAITEDRGEGRRARRAQQLRVAVVPVKRYLPRSFDLQVANFLMEPLVHRVELVPLQEVRQAVGRMHVTPDQLHLPTSLRTLGRRLNADFVMLVEPAGHRNNPHLFVALVDVHSGDTPVAKRLPMPRGRVRASHAEALMPQILATLQAAMPEEPAAEPAIVPAAPAEAEPEPAAGADRARDKDKDKDAEAPATAAAEGEQAFDHPELAHARLGLGLLQRVGHLIDTQNSGVVPPQYAGTNDNSNPFFPAFSFDGRIYSGIVRKSRRHWADGFGLALDLQVTAVNSYTDDDTSSKISSTVAAINALVLYRALILPNKELSPMAELGVGLDYFSFPLPGAQFPGVAFRAADIRLELTFPVHRFVWLAAHAGVRPGATSAGDAGTLLGQINKGLGWHAGGGVGGRYKIFTGEVSFMYRYYALNYTGTTSLAETVTLSDGSQAQFTNIRLTDSLKAIQLRVGVMY